MVPTLDLYQIGGTAGESLNSFLALGDLSFSVGLIIKFNFFWRDCLRAINPACPVCPWHQPSVISSSHGMIDLQLWKCGLERQQEKTGGFARATVISDASGQILKGSDDWPKEVKTDRSGSFGELPSLGFLGESHSMGSSERQRWTELTTLLNLPGS